VSFGKRPERSRSMKVRVRVVGVPKTPYYREGIEDYLRRLQKYLPVSLEFVRGKSGRSEKARAVREESLNLLDGVPERDHVALLDVKGQAKGSVEFSKWFYRVLGQTRGSLVFCIGGPYGVSRKLIDRADSRISLSAMTLPHEMCLLLLLEQLYRAATIHAGGSYHH